MRRLIFAAALSVMFAACSSESDGNESVLDGGGASDSGSDTGGPGADAGEVEDTTGGEDGGNDVTAADTDGEDTPSPDVIDDASATDVPVGDHVRVVSITPAADGEIDSNPTFEIEFDRAVERRQNHASFVSGDCDAPIRIIHVESDRCVGAWTALGDGNRLRVTPKQRLRDGEAYRVEVNGALVAVDGTSPAAEFTADFTVAGGGAPFVRSVAIDGTNDFAAEERIGGTDGKSIFVTWDAERLYVGIDGEDMTRTNLAAYVVIGARGDTNSPGTAHIPGEQWFEGSTTYTPFPASHVFFLKSIDGTPEFYLREWNGVAWQGRGDATSEMSALLGAEFSELSIERAAFGNPADLDIVVYLKDLSSDCAGSCEAGWGWMFGSSDSLLASGPGERILSTYHHLDLSGPGGPASAELRHRMGRDELRPRVYQLLVRTFGNTNESRTANGTLEQNGVGRFADINEAAATELADMGVTHVWMTGVLQQATSTDYSDIGEPADDPDILKGRAGSPYAIRDYFDVCPDYALDPANRTQEFQEAIDRLHDEGLRVMIDFVPNHVARSYRSTVRPELTFGEGDNAGMFYSRDNHFFYLQDGAPPTNMPGYDQGSSTPMSPTCQVLAGGDPSYQCDGIFDWNGQGETEFGRVTGNNVASWSPDINTWYETVKINYGYDYTTRTAEHPRTDQASLPIPSSWWIMDSVIAHWQALGVDGFRVDMAHMVPMEFHAWLISRSRSRDPNVYWMAEAYDNDPAKVTAGNVLHALLGSGYDAVYDDATYDALKDVFDAGRWANDIDNPLLGDPILLHHALRYAENHDEVRLASPHDWQFGGTNAGRDVGVAVSAILHGLGRGPAMIYAGQETGEPAQGAEGFGGDDGRTSIFDYWSMPSFTGWVNEGAYDGGGLDPDTAALRESYIDLFAALDDRLFAEGDAYLLNFANQDNPSFGRVGAESVSGHYAYAYLRYVNGEAALVYAWLHPEESVDGATVVVPSDALSRAGLSGEMTLESLLGGSLPATTVSETEATSGGISLGSVEAGGVRIIRIR